MYKKIKRPGKSFMKVNFKVCLFFRFQFFSFTHPNLRETIQKQQMGCGASSPSPENTSIVPAPTPIETSSESSEPPKPTPTENTVSADPPNPTPTNIPPVSDPDPTTTETPTALIGVQKAAKPPEEGSKEKLDARAAKRKEERTNMKQQISKDRSRFKEGLPTSPIANDANRAREIASFEAATTPPPATSAETTTDPSESESSVVSKEAGLVTTDYS